MLGWLLGLGVIGVISAISIIIPITPIIPITLISYNKKTDCPNGTACIIIYSPKMEFNEGITRLANSDKPQFTCVNEDLAGERNAVITR